MKRLLPLLLLASCTVQNGKEITQYPDGRINQKSFLYASVGSKAKGVQTTPEGGEILEVDDSVSLRNTLTAGTIMYGGYIQKAIEESNNAVTVAKSKFASQQSMAKTAADASVKKAEINASIKMAELAAPQP